MDKYLVTYFDLVEQKKKSFEILAINREAARTKGKYLLTHKKISHKDLTVDPIDTMSIKTSV